jgi:hypothetical protein
MLLQSLVRTLVLSGGLVLMLLVTHEVILPIERMFLSKQVQTGAVFYLPLGYWVCVAYFERWWASVYLAPGLMIGLALYGNPDLPNHLLALHFMVMASTAPMVFAMLSWSSGRENEPMTEPHAWRVIVTAGTITAIANGLGLNLINHGVLPDAVSVPAVVEASASGFVGLIAFLILLAIGFRLQEQLLGQQ